VKHTIVSSCCGGIGCINCWMRFITRKLALNVYMGSAVVKGLPFVLFNVFQYEIGSNVVL
jgi:hypothetical protein